MSWMFFVRFCLRLLPPLDRSCATLRYKHPHIATSRAVFPKSDLQETNLSKTNKRLIRRAWKGSTAFASAPYNALSWVAGSCLPPQPQPLNYGATVSIDLTFPPPGTLNTLLALLDVFKVVVKDAATTYFNPPKDVAFMWTYPAPPDTVRLIATSKSASSTAIIEQNFTDLTVRIFNSQLLRESLRKARPLYYLRAPARSRLQIYHPAQL